MIGTALREIESEVDVATAWDSVSLTIVADQQVLALMEQPAFLESWEDLAARDHKFTAIQEPPFVATWYRTYFAEYSPVLCLGYDPSRRLVGLMPLARHRASGAICHAGAGQAEYHGWICAPEIEDQFPAACVVEVGRRFHPRVWQWRWLPPGASARWLSSPLLDRAGIRARSIARENCLIDLRDDAHLRRIGQRHSLKNNINRHKRAPGFRLERLTSKAEVEQVIDRVAAQYDMRAVAAYGATGFRGDRHKKRFFVERLNAPAAHYYSLLWSKGQILAFNLGACDGERVLLGVFGFNPLEARTSPGTILLLELAQLLKKEGFRYLDLTPGRQPFKAQMANCHEELVLPTFYFSARASLAAGVKDAARAFGRRVLGWSRVDDPHKRQRLIGRALQLGQTLKQTTGPNACRVVARRVFSKVEYCYYRLDCSKLEEDTCRDPAMKVQHYSDLLAYSGSNPRLSRSALVQRSLRRLGEGHRLYSILQNGVLAHYGWLRNLEQRHRLSEFITPLVVPPGSVMLYDFYTEPSFRRQGLYTRTLQQMLRDCRDAGATNVFIAVSARNEDSRRVVEKVGFVPFRRFTRTRILGRSWESNRAAQAAGGRPE